MCERARIVYSSDISFVIRTIVQTGVNFVYTRPVLAISFVDGSIYSLLGLLWKKFVSAICILLCNDG